jgi:hypothetical protein
MGHSPQALPRCFHSLRGSPLLLCLVPLSFPTSPPCRCCLDPPPGLAAPSPSPRLAPSPPRLAPPPPCRCLAPPRRLAAPPPCLPSPPPLRLAPPFASSSRPSSSSSSVFSSSSFSSPLPPPHLPSPPPPCLAPPSASLSRLPLPPRLPPPLRIALLSLLNVSPRSSLSISTYPRRFPSSLSFLLPAPLRYISILFQYFFFITFSYS